MKPIWTILITVVATAAIAGSGTYYLANKSADKDKSDLQAQIDDLSAKVSGTTVTSGDAVTSGATVVDETASWKTYANTTYGFSLKYPESWTKEENSGEGLAQFYSTVAGRSLTSTETKIVVWAIPATSISNLEKYVADNDGKISSSSDITLGGVASKKFVLTPVDDVKFTVVYALHGDSYIKISCLENASNLDTILSTFKFDETLTWKTYTNTTYGFSFKYPSSWNSDIPVHPNLGKDVEFNSPETVAAQKANLGPSPIGPDLSLNLFSNFSALNSTTSTPVNPNIKNIDDSLKSWQAQNIIQITNNNGVKLIEANIPADPRFSLAIATNTNGNIVILYFGNDPTALTETSKTILSTFQFTN